jgi:hypothetical protein
MRVGKEVNSIIVRLKRVESVVDAHRWRTGHMAVRVLPVANYLVFLADHLIVL